MCLQEGYVQSLTSTPTELAVVYKRDIAVDKGEDTITKPARIRAIPYQLVKPTRLLVVGQVKKPQATPKSMLKSILFFISLPFSSTHNLSLWVRGEFCRLFPKLEPIRC